MRRGKEEGRDGMGVRAKGLAVFVRGTYHGWSSISKRCRRGIRGIVAEELLGFAGLGARFRNAPSSKSEKSGT